MKKLLLAGVAALSVLSASAACAKADYLATLEKYSAEFARNKKETLAKLDPEAATLRRQYQEWKFQTGGGESALFDDIESAVILIRYNNECSPISTEKLNRARLFVRTFPEYEKPAVLVFDRWSKPVRGSEWPIFDKESFCRAMNPPPKPEL